MIKRFQFVVNVIKYEIYVEIIRFRASMTKFLLLRQIMRQTKKFYFSLVLYFMSIQDKFWKSITSLEKAAVFYKNDYWLRKEKRCHYNSLYLEKYGFYSKQTSGRIKAKLRSIHINCSVHFSSVIVPVF
jgi:hypothetical protein